MRSIKSKFIYDEIIIMGMFYCPYGKDNYNCFFQWLQKKTTEEKVAWYKSLNNRDKQDLMFCHLKCNCKNLGNPSDIKTYQHN